MLVIGIGLITAITLIKYKPAYSVSISGIKYTTSGSTAIYKKHKLFRGKNR